MKTPKQEFEKKILILITTEGKEIVVSYVIPRKERDYIFMDIRRKLEANAIFYNWHSECEITFYGLPITELDMRKIIGIRIYR